MNDELAIKLFENDGGYPWEWPVIDEVTRLFYRRAAADTQEHPISPPPTPLPSQMQEEALEEPSPRQA